MVLDKGRKKLFTAIAVIGALVLIIATVVAIRAMSPNEPSASTETTTEPTPAVTEEANNTDEPSLVEPQNPADQPVIDPTQISTVAIEPVALIVPYLKGIGGFDYQVLRTPSGTKYVAFSSAKLVGTKCTNDEGQFASIIEKPTTDESATLAKSTTVDGTEYGLSLADATCTNDAGLLKQYQDSFSGAFNLLQKL